ncbi:hypothetical protein H9X90_02865 [Faecalicatena contorta]|uniref:phage tail protein n=1 Tax=Faecalicatena contorta TaxID=39482 RepID=UPI00196023A8|nr:hypothetical protein [Faecalicatena contorta]MBM6686805.1 hypothetical protein [Faecalicatena contorta]MBM6709702.1 hypothetical protein [Faecalicatena contorta]
MATELAKAYVQIIPSAKGIKTNIENEIGGDANAAGISVGNKLAGAIKAAISAAAIGKALGATLTEGAALEQSLGGIETLFKGSADTVIANAQNAYQTAGLSANAYMESVTGFSARLLQSLGGDTEAAAQLANTAMTDMSDNANKMGTNMESIQETYQSLARGNYEMLDNLKLGYGGTQSEMARLINDSGVLGDTMVATAENVNSIGFDKVIEAIHVVQDEMGITGTTAKEASTTLSGSFNSMKASFQNVLGNLALGQDVTPSLNALASTVTTFLGGNLLPAIWNILSALPGALVTFVQALAPQVLTAVSGLIQQIGAGLSNGAQILAMVGNMISQIGNAIITNAPLLFQAANNLISQLRISIQTQLPFLLQVGLNILTNIVNGILTNLPMLITGAAQVVANFISAISSAIPSLLQKGAELILNLVNGIVNNLPQIVSAGAQAIASLATSIGQNLPQILQSGITIIGQLAAGLVRAIPNLVGKIPQIIQSVIDAFGNTDWGAIGTNIISGIANGLASAGGALWDAVSGVLGSFKDKVLSFFGINSPARWGIWVGEMIDAGIAGGLDSGQNAIARAVKNVQRTVKGPFATDMDYSLSRYGQGYAGSRSYDLLDRIQELIEIIRNNSGRPIEVSVMMKDREVLRVLRELGVVFE